MYTFKEKILILKVKGGTDMDQIKIGKFIAECRKKNNLTQMQLAEKLNITDRAISKWETGKSMPDSSIMIALCNELKISVTDLLSGEIVMKENRNENLEKNLLEMIRQKEESDRRLLSFEVLMGVLCAIIFFALTMIASLVQMEEWLRITLIVIGFIPLLVACPFMLKIEQVAGYYECAKCGHRYVPTYKAVNLAPHIGRTRKMRCPKCNKKSWQKKVLTKE